MFVIIAGAGVIGARVAKVLVEHDHDVVVIDIDKDVCESIYSETGAMTIHSSATDIRTLYDAGAKKADMIVCLMRNDADNISCALLAKSLGLEQVVARLRIPQYKQAYQIAGIQSIVDMSELLLDRIIMEIENPKVKKVFTVGAEKAGVYAIHINEEAKVVGQKIKDIAQDKKFPDESVFMGIYRKEIDEFLIPRGNHILKENDLIFIVSKSEFIQQASEFLTVKDKKKRKTREKEA
ncbi:MAG: TrkA family potassium uptake protein [Candidatus Cloacimonetes bacterium]|nr:TrkA family potassium uptake protein [Candidatus Cloacimonadota bacterium]MCF7815164.1 TrkA family potassium uptake protein [Candidatus Cloacimonadota bacterium]MCF7869378.1 TrkA family potassium uptake protein [Candidatus Cloacimonadota bacterium]MCF7884780.1 TrkA family potassium uptake protein [Candidatus Cloacimonadota bacterium]